MPVRVSSRTRLLPPTFADALAAATGPLVGMWVASGSPIVTEICAGAGPDWLIIDTEHSPLGLESVVACLQAAAPYPVAPVVRLPVGDEVLIKRFLDLGAQNLLVPMVDSAEQARAVVRATRYPPAGTRGVGAALARSSRWGRITDYLPTAEGTISVLVQIESAAGVAAARDILGTPGLAGVFVGPSDLAASMGHRGDQGHRDVVAAVERVLAEAVAAGVPAGVNAFDGELARRYVRAGARFVAVGADVTLLTRGSADLAAAWAGQEGESCAGPGGPTHGGSPTAVIPAGTARPLGAVD